MIVSTTCHALINQGRWPICELRSPEHRFAIASRSPRRLVYKVYRSSLLRITVYVSKAMFARWSPRSTQFTDISLINQGSADVELAEEGRMPSWKTYLYVSGKHGGSKNPRIGALWPRPTKRDSILARSHLVYGPGPQKGWFHYQSRGKGSLCFLASLLCLEHKMMW